MSVLYPDLPLTTFPSGGIDTFTTWLNIVATDGPLIQQYQAAMKAGNQTLANQILAQIPQGTQKIITATDLNTLTQAMLAVERFYLTDIEPYISQQQESWLNVIQQFSYQGVWHSGTSYVTNNFVQYTISGLTMLFLAINDPPIGTVPTNQNYWRVLTIQGQQGTSGQGLSYRQYWVNSTVYNVNDSVTYNAALWMAIQNNQNQEPVDGSSYWTKIMNLEVTTYPIQDTEPTNLQLGGLWFNTQDNPTEYYYLENLENPITQEMIPMGYQTYGAQGVVLNGTGPLPIPSGGTNATTSQNALAALGAGVRPNELDNPGLDVNQKGQSSYDTSKAASYTVDRWWGIFGTYDTESKTITGKNETYRMAFRQPISNPSRFAGKTATFTAWIASGKGNLTIVKATGINSGQVVIASKVIDGPGLYSVTTQVPIDVGSEAYPYLNFGLSTQIVGAMQFASPIPFKAEFGEGQTLAYQDSDGNWQLLPQPESDYATQLQKCRAYYWESDGWFSITENDYVLTSGVNKFIKTNIRFPVSMNRIPTVTILSSGEKTPGILSDWASNRNTEIQAFANPASVFQSGFESIYSTTWVNGNYTFRVIANAEL